MANGITITLGGTNGGTLKLPGSAPSQRKVGGSMPSIDSVLTQAKSNLSAQGLSSEMNQYLQDLGAGGKKATQAYNKIVNDPSIPDEFKQQAKSIIDGQGHKSWLQKALDMPVIKQALWTASLPERAVLTAAQLGSEGASDLGIPGFASADKIKHLGIGDVLHNLGDQGYGYTQFRQQTGRTMPSGIPGVALGIAGDVAADPLTYLTGGVSALAKTGEEASKAAQVADAVSKVGTAGTVAKGALQLGKGGVFSGVGRALSRKEIASALESAGQKAAANEVRKIGKGAVTAEQLAGAGLKGGVQAYVPLSRTLSKVLRNPNLAKSVEFLSHDTLQPLEKTIGKAAFAAEASKPVTEILDRFGGKTGQVKAEALRNAKTGEAGVSLADAEKAKAAFDVTSVETQAIHNRLGAQLKEWMRPLQKAKVDEADVARMVEEGGQRATIEGGKVVGDLASGEGRVLQHLLDKGVSADEATRLTTLAKQWAGSTRAEINRSAATDMLKDGRPVVQAVDEGGGYLPHLLSDLGQKVFGSQAEANKAVLGRASRITGLPKQFFEKQRLLKDDTYIPDLGKTVGELPGATQLERANNALVEVAKLNGYTSKGFDKAVAAGETPQLLRNDAYQLLPDYLSSVSRAAGTHGLVRNLVERKIINPLDNSLRVKVADQNAAAPSTLIGVGAQRRLAQAARNDPLVRDHLVSAATTETLMGHVDAAIGQTQKLIDDARKTNPEGAVNAKQFMDAISPSNPIEVNQALTFRAQAALMDSADAEKFLQALPHQLSDNENVIHYWTGAASDGMKAFSAGNMGGMLEAPDVVMKAFFNMGQVAKDPSMLLNAFDGFTRFLKKWQIHSPGFIARNVFGGVINNWAFGVDGHSYTAFRLADRAFHKGQDAFEKFLGKQSAADQEVFHALAEGGGFDLVGRVEGEFFESRGLTFNKLAAFESQRRLNDFVERQMRGALMYDQMAKGANFEDATQLMFGVHFNYDDLSHVEKDWARRVIPFWTWTKNNLPLQISLAWRNPKLYDRYTFVKNNFADQAGSESPFAPSYLGDLGSIFLGNIGKTLGLGGDSYYTADLPFRQAQDTLSKLADPARLLENANPILKTPIEAKLGVQFFSNLPLNNNLTPLPTTWRPLIPVLVAAGWLTPSKNGNLIDGWMITNKHAYEIEQYLPFLGRLRRLVPNEPKYQQRAVTSWLSWLGISSTVDTQAVQQSVAYQRADQLTQLSKDLQARGYASAQPKPTSSKVPAIRTSLPGLSRSKTKAITIPAKGGRKVAIKLR